MDKREIIELLQVKDKEQEKLFSLARETRKKYFGDKSFVRGVVEISNYCKNNCDYCGMRKDNKKLKRYRMSASEIIGIAQQIKNIGIHTIFLQEGEGLKTTKIVEEILPKIKKLGLTTILCLGNKTAEEYRRLKDAGADKYIIKYETSDAKLHKTIRHQFLKDRLQCLENLLDLNYKVGTGTIVGLPGQSLESVADDILLAKGYEVNMISASPFIPSNQTPFWNKPYGDFNLTLNTMAAMRLIFPKALIPSVSALEKLETQGQLKGFNAGANVITINYTPLKHRKNYVIYTTDRKIVSFEHAKKTIDKAGLKFSI